MRKNAYRLVNLASFMAILIFLIPAIAEASDAQQALTWLGGHQRADGAWCGTEESSCAAVTAEVVSTLVPMAAQAPIAATMSNRAAPFMQNVMAHDADTLAQKLLVGRLTGYFKNDDLLALSALKTSTNGFAVWNHEDTADYLRTIHAIRFLIERCQLRNRQ